MTEELKQKAREYIKVNNLEWELECHRTSPIGEVEQAYIAGATEATKELQEATKKFKSDYHELCNLQDMRIAELEKQNKELQAELDYAKNNCLFSDCDRVARLEKQIEKMKCGQNCKHSYLYQEDRKCKFTYCDCINCKDKWELSE